MHIAFRLHIIIGQVFIPLLSNLSSRYVFGVEVTRHSLCNLLRLLSRKLDSSYSPLSISVMDMIGIPAQGQVSLPPSTRPWGILECISCYCKSYWVNATPTLDLNWGFSVIWWKQLAAMSAACHIYVSTGKLRQLSGLQIPHL